MATGTPPLTYQWMFDGISISGATSSTSTLSNVQAAEAASYSVTVMNSIGSVTSDMATLKVN